MEEEKPEGDIEEEPAGEEITPEEDITETWTDVLPLREVMVQTYDEIDNLSLFQSYVEQLLQGESGFDSSMQLWSEPEGEKLSGVSRKAYELLRKQLEEIANGSETNTTINLSVQELGIYGGWSLEALELENFDDEEAVIDALAEKLWMELDYNAVLTSLRVDLSMAMYWFDPTVGVSIHLQGGIRTTGDGQDALILGVQFRFAVEETFQGEEGGYTTDPSWVLNAEAALAKLNGYTLNQVNLANASGSSISEDGIQTQVETWGAVGGILLEKDYKITSVNLAFDGGYITKYNVPTAKYDTTLANMEFLRAYVEISGERYPIIFLGKQNGEVYYLLDASANDSAATQGKVQKLSRLQSMDKIIFSYRSSQQKYDVRYKYNQSYIAEENLGSVGVIGARLTSIEIGEVKYFQIVRTPGKTLTVSGVNADITLVSDGYVTTNGSSFVQTYRVSKQVIGEVTIEIEAEWKKTSYDISLIIQAEHTTGSAMTGSLKVESIQDNTTTGNVQLNKEQAIQGASSQTVLSVATSTTMNQNNLDTGVYFTKIHNTIYDENTGSYQELDRIVIGAEEILLPTISDSAETTLIKGESHGTKIMIRREGMEQVSSSTTREVAVYSIEVIGIHTDLSILMKYVSSERNQSMYYKIIGLQGVEAQIYTKQDNKIRWETLNIGSYYYAKNAVTPRSLACNSTYTIRWRHNPGYFSSELYIVVKNASGVNRIYRYTTQGVSEYTSYLSSVDAFWDGYYTVELKDVKLVEGEVAYVSFASGILKYEFSYPLENGAWFSENIDPTLVDKYYYPIEYGLRWAISNNFIPRAYQIGEFIDISLLRLWPENFIQYVSIGISMEDVGRPEFDSIDTVLLDYNHKLRKSDGTYEEETWTHRVSKYTTIFLLHSDNYPVICMTNEGFYLNHVWEKSDMSWGEGATGMPVLYYEHPAIVFYTAGIDVANSEVTGMIPEKVITYAFETLEVSTSRLTRNGYKHIGWIDVSTGKQYLFDDIATQSFGEENGIEVFSDNQEMSIEVPWDGTTLAAVWETIEANDITITPEEGDKVTNEWLLQKVGARVYNTTTGATLRYPTVAENTVTGTPGVYSVTFYDEQTGLTKTISVTVYAESIFAQNALFTQSEVTGLTAEKLIQYMNAKAWKAWDKSQTVPITKVDYNIPVAAGTYNVTFSTDYGTSITVKAVVTPTVEEFGVNPWDQTVTFVATKPGESTESALRAAGVILGAAVQGTGKNFVIIGPNNTGFFISGATGTGYILANKDRTGYTLPGAGGNFLITGTHNAGYQVLAPTGKIYDVIGDIDTGYFLVSQDKKLHILRGNSVTGFYVEALDDTSEESKAEQDAIKQSPLTTGRTRSVYPIGYAGGLFLALYCVMQWNPPRKKFYCFLDVNRIQYY